MTQTRSIRPAMILAAAAILVSSLPAMAREAGDTLETREAVHINRADLATAAGVAEVRARVVRAARQACQPMGTTRKELAHGKACFDSAVTQGNAQVDRLLAERGTPASTDLAASTR